MSDSRNGGLALRTQKRYGWRADGPDMRDYLLAVEPAKSLPRRVSLRPQMPEVYDQGQLGSCTANSIGAILEFNELKQAESDAATPSSPSATSTSRASSTSSAVTPGGRAGPTTATSGCRRATSPAATSRRTSG